jgi:predicted membrane channel-forming protein YqfA (hemolysin III family)
MKCPACKHQFRLTMREYLREPLGRHDCPACKQPFKLKRSFSYVLLLAVAVLLVAGVPGILVWFFTQRLVFGALAYVVAAIVFVLPIDRWLDDSFREAELSSR